MLMESNVLTKFSDLIENEKTTIFKGPLKTGVDLGTANIVIAVVDSDNNPIAGATAPSKVVKDGIVVDFIGAITTLKRLKSQLEEQLGTELRETAIAVPPGISQGNIKCIQNVVEAAGFDVIKVVDEPTAAATVLNIKDGAVVDVGGGTTGISILSDGEVIFSADEPTGGNHMSLVLSGSYHISLEEAEEKKKNLSIQDEVFTVVKPVVEKMAAIVKDFLKDFCNVKKIYVVGGACMFKEFEAVFEKEVGIKTVKCNNPLLVTPLGIAINCEH